MTEQHHTRSSNPLNANLVSFILIINFVVIGGLISANKPQSNGEAHSEVALGAPTVTPPPPTLTSTPPPATSTPEQIDIAGEFEGDAAKGEVLFNTFQAEAGFACATCHRADSEDRLIGPGLLNVRTRAETRVDGLDAVQYIRTSIIDPGNYVVDGFPDGLMPRNWAAIYAGDPINDLIAYLLSLQ